MILNWAKGTIEYPEVPGAVTQIMHPGWYGGPDAVDCATGEKLREIVAYDSVRKIVDHLLTDANGKIVMNAAGDGPAVVTEFRELIIAPPARPE